MFAGGPVFRPGGRPVEAVGVIGGSIVAVGDMADVRRAVGGRYEPIDLGGRMLLPGFQDAHVHPVWGGLIRMRCDLEAATGPDEALDMVRRYVADHPDVPWIVGGGWRYEWFPSGNPPASLLDGITDRPVYLTVADGHSGWANTAAIRLAGVDAATADPADGVIVRNDDGTPQGTVHEGAMDLIDRAVPADTPEDLVGALEAGQRYLLSLGITAWQDAWVTDEVDAAYRALAAEGGLLARVRAALVWDRNRGPDQLAEIVERSAATIGGYVPRSVKLMLDGVVENHTACMLHPYLDGEGSATTNHGLDFIQPGELREIVTAVDAAGLQTHFHALGDGAVRNALDAIAAARTANGPSDTRPHLAHLQVIDPADIPRFAALGAVATIQPLWAQADAAMTELTIPFLGEERAALQYPFADLVRAGARLAMGSDWSVSTPDVLQQVAVAVNRNDPAAGIHEPYLPEQRLDVITALTAVTEGSAHVNHFDTDSGRIEPGLHADLVVVGGNPYTDPIHELGVDLTMIGGSVIWQRPGAD